MSMLSAVPSRHPKYRTKLCRNFANGNCPFGHRCSFLHAAPRINTSSSSIAQHLFNWNPLLLSQLLAFSNQQGTQKKMPQRSAPRSQGPQLIDEDPSLSTSLLLSMSDCTSSEQMPQTRRSSRRKKYPCRHFIRTGGWCPVAGQCRFHHDVAALPSADVQKAEQAPPFATDAHGGGRTISGGVLMGREVLSPPTIDVAHSEPPRYNEAKLVQPCSSPHDPLSATVLMTFQTNLCIGPTTPGNHISHVMPLCPQRPPCLFPLLQAHPRSCSVVFTPPPPPPPHPKKKKQKKNKKK
jgi:hypothetical protein